MDVYVLFESDAFGLNAFLGTYSSVEIAVEQAKSFLDTVLLFCAGEAATYDLVKYEMGQQNSIFLTAGPGLSYGVMILKSELDIPNFSND